MDKQAITINGNRFTDLETFYDEIDSLFTKDLDWKTGHNLNAFNDLLWGGFEVYEYEERIKLIWVNFSKSKRLLGEDLINVLVQIIIGHEHIEFVIQND